MSALASETTSGEFRVYSVDKKVSDFPPEEDFSTPEAAYAVINRLMASGNRGRWRRISVKELARRLPPEDAKPKEVKPEVAEQWLSARIVEVRVFRDSFAGVIAEVTAGSKPPFYDLRSVGIEDGRWLNGGQSVHGTLDEARSAFARGCARRYIERPDRPKVKDAEAHLKPFVEFLKSKAEEPKGLVMKALAEHKVVIMGEIHHRPRYWAFNCSLVTEPEFARHIGVIYLELPSNDQNLVDTFLAGNDCDTTPVIEMLRDMLWMGWPDQPMLDFFVTVWMRNQRLGPEQRLRIVLVDMQRPWSQIKERGDWRRYDTDRDRLMADNILRDIREHPAETRNGLFIVGVGHTALDLEYLPEFSVKSAGWHLREALGPDDVYAIFQHRAVQTNMGRVDGRLCLGLFDSAFAAQGNKPMAFPLDVGPFGKEPYDADPENPVISTYADGFDAYLYLGPLETEIRSPLIAGFYTDAFVQELDRRFRLMYGKSWAEAYRQEKMNPETFIAWMGNSWGKPRRKWWPGVIGPPDAWHRGGRDWKKPLADEKLAHVMEHPEEVAQAARQLFEGIRDADYDASLSGRTSWMRFPTFGRYMARSGHDQLVQWICRTFKDNPIVSIEIGEVFLGDEEIRGRRGWPTVRYKLTLRDGAVLQGQLAFEYNFDEGEGHWHGMQGIDWHLGAKEGQPAPLTP
jgi:hypothetical protein